MLSTELFDFDLPPELIAQQPSERRDASRLLVVDRKNRTVAHHTFSELPQFLRPTDTLFRNNAAVLAGRLRGRRSRTGGAVECLLLRVSAEDPNSWWCLLKPGRRLPVGVGFASGEDFSAEVLEKRDDGTALVRFSTPEGESIADVAQRIGQVPLPPYILREGTSAERTSDLGRYETVYADPKKRVAAAAPTAGLHFTPELLVKLAAQGVEFADITLQVGLGTFKPISTASVSEHVIHRETYELSPETQRRIIRPRGRRVAVGTTSIRAIEDFLRQHSAPKPETHFAETDIFIYPPSVFLGVDAAITNFHQPRSTLLCLVAALLTPGSTDGIEWLREIYREAMAERYRFFSYGDAMLIL
jgi:S-adenosylmethionine:tRNA ribosyltransferase-isomerase